MTNVPSEKSEHLNEINFWKSIIPTALLDTMTADNLLSNLLSDYYGNIDTETDLIVIALNMLIESGEVKVKMIKLNAGGRAESYLFSTRRP